MTVAQAIWKIVRPMNLIIVMVTMIVIGRAIQQQIEIPVDWSMLIIYAICLSSIAAGGNIINDILDINSDRVNKKTRNPIGRELPVQFAWTLYATFTFMGLFVGWMMTEEFNLQYKMLILTAALLALYSLILQKLPIIGNLTVALLCSFPVLLASLIFIPKETWVQFSNPVSLNLGSSEFWQFVILGYAILAFAITFLREMVKDIEDMAGDSIAGYSTLPVLVGFKQAKKFVFLQGLVFLIWEGIFVCLILWNDPQLERFLILFVSLGIVPLLISTLSILKVKTPQEAKSVSHLLKLTLVLGMLSSIYFWFL